MMTHKRGMCLLTLASLLALGGLAGWAEGSAEAGRAHPLVKEYSVPSRVSVVIQRGDFTIEATRISPTTACWLGLAAVSGSVTLEGVGAPVPAIAGIQVFDFVDPKYAAKAEEVTKFGRTLSLVITSEQKNIEHVALYIPESSQDPAYHLVVDKSSQGAITKGPFIVVVEVFQNKTVRLVVESWPAGDPIICCW